MKMKSPDSSAMLMETGCAIPDSGFGFFDTSPGFFLVFLLLGQLLGQVLVAVGLDSLVRKIDPLRVFPILVEDLHQSLDQVGIAKADTELTTFIEALWIDVEGAQKGSLFISKDQLRMEMDSLEFVHIDAEILQQTQTGNTFENVKLSERVNRESRGVYLHVLLHLGVDESLDDGSIDILFVLDVE
jgi:hypothetical protein